MLLNALYMIVVISHFYHCISFWANKYIIIIIMMHCSMNFNFAVLISVALADVGIQIFNGTDAFPGQFPYVAAFRVSVFTDLLFKRWQVRYLANRLQFKVYIQQFKLYPVNGELLFACSCYFFWQFLYTWCLILLAIFPAAYLAEMRLYAFYFRSNNPKQHKKTTTTNNRINSKIKQQHTTFVNWCYCLREVLFQKMFVCCLQVCLA